MLVWFQSQKSEYNFFLPKPQLSPCWVDRTLQCFCQGLLVYLDTSGGEPRDKKTCPRSRTKTCTLLSTWLWRLIGQTSWPCLYDGLIVHSKDMGRSHDEWEDADTYFQGAEAFKIPEIRDLLCLRQASPILPVRRARRRVLRHISLWLKQLEWLQRSVASLSQLTGPNKWWIILSVFFESFGCAF